MPEQIPETAAGGTLKNPRLVTPDMLREWPLPAPSGTKYTRGQAVVVGGSCATPGAVLLAAPVRVLPRRGPSEGHTHPHPPPALGQGGGGVSGGSGRRVGALWRGGLGWGEA